MLTFLSLLYIIPGMICTRTLECLHLPVLCFHREVIRTNVPYLLSMFSLSLLTTSSVTQVAIMANETMPIIYTLISTSHTDFYVEKDRPRFGRGEGGGRRGLTSCVLIPLCTMAAFRLYLFTVSRKVNKKQQCQHVNFATRVIVEIEEEGKGRTTER